MPAHETRTSSTSTSSTSASDTPADEVYPVDAGYGATAAAYTSSSVAAAETGPVASGVKDYLKVQGAMLGDTTRPSRCGTQTRCFPRKGRPRPTAPRAPTPSSA